MTKPLRVLVLGCGYAGLATARAAASQGLEVCATVRNPERAEQLADEPFEVLCQPRLLPFIAARVDDRSQVIVTFPPDGETDAAIAPTLAHAAAITYISTTGVWGDTRGVIDEATPLPEQPTAAASVRLAAEAVWHASGATILRCPGIYGRDRGLHERVRSGRHAIGGDGSNYTSRIHVDDLAELALRASAAPREMFVVGDHEPAPQATIVAWICKAYSVAMPPFVPLEDVPLSLRGDRQIDARRIRVRLGVSLRFPSWREGMMPSRTS